MTLKWAVWNHSRDFLYYSANIQVYTHNNPVSYFTTSDILTATGQRWVNEVAEFTFPIHYASAKQNMIPETLSWIPKSMHTNALEPCTTTLPHDQVKAILGWAKTKHLSIQSWTASLDTEMGQEQRKILTNLTTWDKYSNINYLSRVQQEEHWILRITLREIP